MSTYPAMLRRRQEGCALTQAETVLLWDAADRTLIAANVVGTMPWTERAEPGPPGR